MVGSVGDTSGHSDSPLDNDDEPLLPPEDLKPAPPPGHYRRGGSGCVWQLAFFVVMLVLGALAAATLRAKSGTHFTTLGEGSVKGQKGAVEWKVKASEDEQRARCITLFVANSSDPLTGGCIASAGAPSGSDVHEAPLPGTMIWVVFGQAPKGVKSVRLPLTNGSTKVLPVQNKGGVPDRFYVWMAPPGVHTSGDAELIGP